LFKAQASVNNFSSTSQMTSFCSFPLHIACQKGWLEIVKLLIEAKANVNKIENENACRILPLTHGIWAKSPLIVKLLIDSNGDVNHEDRQDGSPLEGAVQVGNLEIINLLLDAKASVNYDNNKRWYSVLHQAAKYGNIELMKFLIVAQANINSQPHSHFKQYETSALSFVMKYDEVLLEKLLIEAKAELDIILPNNNNENSRKNDIYLAILYGDISKLKQLIECKAWTDINQPIKKKIGNHVSNEESALHSAVRTGNTEMVKFLLEAKASGINQESVESTKFPLFVAVCNRQIEMARLLIDSKANINQYQSINVGYTSLHHACDVNDIEMVKLLIASHAALNVGVSCDFCLLDVAATSSNVEIVKLLIEAKSDVNAAAAELRFQPLHFAVSINKKTEVMKILIDHNAVVVADKSIESPLYAAVANENLEAFKILIQHIVQVNLPLDDSSFFRAAQSGLTEFLKLLIEAKANINQIREHDKLTPLCRCVLEGHVDAARLLIEHKAEIYQTVEAIEQRITFELTTNSPFLLAALENNIEMIHLFLEMKGDINQDGLRCIIDQRELHGTDYKYLSSPSNVSVFTGSILAGNFEMVELLIELKADINKQYSLVSSSSYKQYQQTLKITPLFIAAENDKLEICKLLIEHKADFTNRESIKSMMLLPLGYTEIIRLLMESGDKNEDTQTLSIGSYYFDSI